MDNLMPDVPDVDTLENMQEEELLKLLHRLKTAHRVIDEEIEASAEIGVSDMLKIRRMKKVKLVMKDKISFIENQLTPDIIA